MSRIRSFWRLSWAQRSLLLEACLWLGLARAAVLTFPFRWIMRALGQTVGAAAPPTDLTVLPELHQISWAIQMMSQHTPWTSNCLAQALAGLILLRRRGIASTLYLGVTKEGATQLAAHAWLHSADVIVTGGYQLDRYAVLASFSPKK